MKLYILVEGPSEESFLTQWLPKLIPQHSFKIIIHQGKGRLPRASDGATTRTGLLDQLPMKLRAYGRSLDPSAARVLVLLDQDLDDCRELKLRIENVIDKIEPKPVVMVRIATRETEAFYLGDEQAMRDAYPRLNIGKLRDYQNRPEPEVGTWEDFAEIIRDASENKVQWAETMAVVMETDYKRSGSTSFRAFCEAVLKLVGERV